MTAIAVNGVTKRFGDLTAVQDLTFAVDDGEIFGFLGPNGAGKTTTIDLLLDFVRPTAGELTVLGHSVGEDPVAIRRRCGVLPEGAESWGRLTGRQHLEFAIDSKDAPDTPEDILSRVGLADAGEQQAGEYSSGMEQRLLLGMALVGDPDLLILDEPSSGLDPNGAREMRRIVRDENERGATVFFSSHLLDQVEAVCDRVGILRAGSMVAEDTVDGLRESIGTESTLRVQVDRIESAAITAVEEVSGVSTVTTDEGEPPTIVVHTSGPNAPILGALEGAGIEVVDFTTEEASLEDVFQAYTTDEEVQA